MGVIDNFLLAVAPERALRRIKARAAAAAVMNYDAASKGRRTHGWRAPGTSADAAAYGTRATLRQLSRDMIRNRALAVRGRDVIAGNVVGTGILPSVRAASDDDTSATPPRPAWLWCGAHISSIQPNSASASASFLRAKETSSHS